MKQGRVKSNHKQQSGFTLIEIMVVVIIISILSALVAPQFFSKLDQAKEIAVKNDIKAIESQMEMYKLDNYEFPNTGEGIKALVSDTGKRTWSGPYLKETPLDPWENEYQYQFPGTKNPSGVDIWSLGADGQPGGEGAAADLGNWKTSE